MATDHHSQSAVDLAGLLALAPPPLVPINAKDLQHELDDHFEDEAHARQYGGRTIMPIVEPANYRICRDSLVAGRGKSIKVAIVV